MFGDSKNNLSIQQIGKPVVHARHDFQNNVPLNWAVNFQSSQFKSAL
jgi:hypothetical protein